MLFFADDEHDEDRDEEEEDADFEDNSDDEEEDSDDEEDGEESDDSEDSDEEDDDEDDDDKPVTRKEMRDLLKALKKDGNKRNALRRVASKDNKGRVTKQPSDTDRRLSSVEKTVKETQLLERKRSFGYDNNLSPKQVNYVFRLTKRPTTAFLAKPHVKAALDAIKSQENIARNTPSGSGKRGGNGGNGKKWSELKPEERQTGFADRRREILASKGR